MTTRKTVRLRDDDALEAFSALRGAIEDLDRLMVKLGDGDAMKPRFAQWRKEKYDAYCRIAKALGLKPTLSTTP
jgi:hypothetical protein